MNDKVVMSSHYLYLGEPASRTILIATGHATLPGRFDPVDSPPLRDVQRTQTSDGNVKQLSRQSLRQSLTSQTETTGLLVSCTLRFASRGLPLDGIAKPRLALHDAFPLGATRHARAPCQSCLTFAFASRIGLVCVIGRSPPARYLAPERGRANKGAGPPFLPGGRGSRVRDDVPEQGIACRRASWASAVGCIWEWLEEDGGEV